MAGRENEGVRLTFQEQMDLIRISAPPGTAAAREHGERDADRQGEPRWYMGTRAAWAPGADLFRARDKGVDMPIVKLKPAAFGGHVYSQSALAVCRAWREEEDRRGVPEGQRQGLHSIHGYFTIPGMYDRPFLYTVETTTASRQFSTLSVVARQPTQPSNSAAGDHFPLEDAALPMSQPCYHAICSFKLNEPHSAGADEQEPPPQKRFADILARRRPQDWPPSPPVDLDGIVRFTGPELRGLFPMLEMNKVDMSDYNRTRPLHERRELLLYRLLAPLPADGTDGWDANAHILVHAYEADRNGLLMLGNHLGMGDSFGRAASLSYSFVVHTGADETVMRFEEQDDDAAAAAAGGGWWVQEVSFPRAAHGRGIVTSKIWSPRGLHVATEYQDGVCRGHRPSGKI